MLDDFVDNLIFIGMGLYLFSSVLFFNLWHKTIQTTDGIGLKFLQILTFGIFIGSLTVFITRFCNYFLGLDSEIAKAVAIINPLVMLVVGFYLRYLFNNADLKKKIKIKL